MCNDVEVKGTDMDQDWRDWRRGVDERLGDLTTRVAVLTRDLRWIGGLILVVLMAQAGADLNR
ncbi:MAG TPA: hypothetical protein VNU01_07120 [Egibacteraceae bacterium]|nr:hypothetical protein [Egibacteraceae bacterium]